MCILIEFGALGTVIRKRTKQFYNLWTLRLLYYRLYFLSGVFDRTKNVAIYHIENSTLSITVYEFEHGIFVIKSLSSCLLLLLNNNNHNINVNALKCTIYCARTLSFDVNQLKRLINNGNVYDKRRPEYVDFVTDLYS